MEKAAKTRFGSRSLGGIPGLFGADARRTFLTPFFYILFAVALIAPVLIAVMTSMNAGDGGALITCAWDLLAGSSDSTSITSMCNSGMMYFLVAILGAKSVSDDFSSGYAKNLFSTRPKKLGYAVSKTLCCSLAGALLLIAFFAGSAIGGLAAGLTFETADATGVQIFLCMLSRVFLVPLFAGIGIIMGCVGKRRLWLSVLLSLFVGMFLFMVVSIAAPLAASAANIVMCLAGGLLFAAALCVGDCLILDHTALA